MSGCHAGVHVLLRKYMPKSIYIHCSAHRLNLVINDTCKVVCYMSDYFSILSNIHSFFIESSVTNTNLWRESLGTNVFILFFP